MFVFKDICYVLLNNIEMFLMIVIAIGIWGVLMQNAKMKRKKDLMELNLIKQEIKYEMELSRAMNENRELRNTHSTRELLSDIRTERKKIVQSAKRENRRKDARGDNSRRGQRSFRKTRTSKEGSDFFNSLKKTNSVLGTVLPFVMQAYNFFKK